jgi:hypothetical protein
MWPFWSKLASSNSGPKPRMRTVEGIDCFQSGFEAFGSVFDGRRPEVPLHLELVGHVVVELLGGFGDGVFDAGFGRVSAAVVVDVDALVGGGFGEAERVSGGGRDALVAADGGELAQTRRGSGGGGEAEVGEPETEVKLICHMSILDLSGAACVTQAGVAARMRR